MEEVEAHFGRARGKGRSFQVWVGGFPRQWCVLFSDFSHVAFSPAYIEHALIWTKLELLMLMSFESVN